MSVWRPLSLCVLLCLTLAALPSFAAAPFEMIVAGELAYGVPHDVAIQGNYAYVAAQGAVSVLDISNPSHPVQIAAIDTPGSAEGIAISGTYAYVADWDSGLRIVNIAIPAQPVEVGHYDTPGFAYGVAVQGNYAYVADHAAGLEIINVTTKSNPTLAGRYDTPGYAWNVAVSGDYAFVADGFAGLLVLDVSNPASPVVADSCTATDRVMDVAVSGDYAYLADGTAGLRVVGFDAGPPLSLTCNTGSLALAGRALGVFVSGDLVYLASDSAGLHVVDVVNPASPALVDSFDTTGRAYAVAVSGTAALVADDSGGLRVIDVSAEPAPVIVGHAATSGNAEAVAVEDAIAYVADGDGGLRAFDVGSVTAPTELWACAGSLNAMDVALDGDYAYVADWAGKLRVLDAASPSAPVCDVGSADIGGHPNGVAIAGTRAYVAAGEAGLAIVNIGNPTLPNVLYTLDTPGSANGVAVSGAYAYVADGASGLQILDVSSPTGIAVGSAETSGYCWDVALADSYAFVASGNAGLEIFNVANPASPAKVKGLPLAGSAHGVALRDNYAFVTVGGRGLVVVDVSNPAGAAVVTSCGTPSVPGPSDLAIAGGYAYVADAESGLVIIDIVSPYVALAALESPAYGERLALTESGDAGIGYFAAGRAGLQIVRVTDSEDAINPSLVRTNRTLGEVTDVALGTAYGYVTDASGRLSIMNTANATNPFTVGSVATSGSALGVATTQVSAGSYALVAGGYAGLSAVRTSVVTNPTEQTVTDTPGWCSDVAAATLSGDPFALVADGDAGLRLLNLTPIGTGPVTVLSEGFETASSLNNWTQWPIVEWNSLSPKRGSGSVRLRTTGSITRVVSTVGYEGLSGWCYLGVSGLEADEYVRADWSADGGATWPEENTLGQVLFGDPEADGQLHRFIFDLPAMAEDSPDFTLRFSIYGDDANDCGYVDDVVIESDSSSQPNEVGFYNTPGQASGVTVAKSGEYDYALVADGDAGLRIIDVSSPGSPTEVGHYDTAGYAESVTSYGGNIAVVADGSNGLVLLNFSSPTAPFEIAHYDTPGWATDAKVLNGHAWVADSGWGLTILQLWYSFRDILFGNWAFLEIEDATSLDNKVSNRIAIGYPDGKYHPELTCTRDQMCVFIARAMNWVQWDEAMALDVPLFVDVPAEHWAGKAIQACTGTNPDGIVVVFGYSDNFFRPTAVVQRDSMCVFIARANEWIDPNARMDTAPQIFPDVWASYWSGTAIQACVAHAVVKGYPDGYYRPWLPVTRDQMAVFIWRAFLR